MHTLWQHLPVIVRAILSGAIVAVVGAAPWSIFVKANEMYLPAVPWAEVPSALWLWLFWRYLQGAGPPWTTADVRRTSCRANSLSARAWGMSLFAGGLALVSLVFCLGVVNRLVRLPAQQTGDLSHIPIVTLVFWLVMGSVVAGVVEEAAFRGYIQGPIERRHGPLVAILVTGILFGFAHFTHPEVTLTLVPYYLIVATIYGALAWLTNSILPGIVLHAVGNILGGIDLLARGRSEWQTSASTKPLVWETGPDAMFWSSCVAAFLVGALALWAYAMLAGVARNESQGDKQ